MGLLRWLLLPRREKDPEEDEPRRGRSRGKPKKRPHQPGVYRIEVDNEASRFHGDGPPFSFWSSSRVILILSFLLWWIQPAGPMIAGYVGGRRAGSPMKAVSAALLPVFAIYVANAAYAHNFAAHQIDFVASLPMVISDAASSILPFLVPYREFMVAYMRGFAEALSTTFGMGTNGYLMVVIFSYIGGLIAEQTRRELVYRSGSGSSVGVNLVQPLLGARPYVDDEEEAYEEDEEVHRSRRPTRARAHGHHASPVVSTGRRRRHHGPAESLDEYRKVSAEASDSRSHRAIRSHRPEDEEADEDDEDGEDVVVTRTHHVPHEHAEEAHDRRRRAHGRDQAEDDEAERPEVAARPAKIRSQTEERAIQRFVERALKNYDHSKL